MNINSAKEQISALLDSELDEARLEAGLASLRQPEGRAEWEIYHQIGDILRSDAADLTLNADFNHRLFARLDAEPIILAPMAAAVGASAVTKKHSLRRFALPGMVAAAAVATVAFVTTPQLMVAGSGTAVPLAVSPMPALADAAPLKAPVLTVPVAAVAAATANPESTVLRDPRIDDYLFAHQRFSSSVYSSAQFARSATFAAEPDK